MKVIVIFILFLSFKVLSQSTDTTCIKYRWISIKNTPENVVFFPNKQKGINEFDLFLFVLNKAESGEINIYTQGNDFNKLKWYPIPQLEIFDGVDYKDPSFVQGVDGNYEIKIQSSTTPLSNSYGEDSVVFVKGISCTVYPPANLLKMSVYDVNEIRIAEERYFDSIKQIFAFRPVAMSFFQKKGLEQGTELFSIQLSEISNLNLNPKKYLWYNALIERQYKGFQYLQISCYDDLLRK